MNDILYYYTAIARARICGVFLFILGGDTKEDLVSILLRSQLYNLYSIRYHRQQPRKKRLLKALHFLLSLFCTTTFLAMVFHCTPLFFSLPEHPCCTSSEFTR